MLIAVVFQTRREASGFLPDFLLLEWAWSSCRRSQHFGQVALVVLFAQRMASSIFHPSSIRNRRVKSLDACEPDDR